LQLDARCSRHPYDHDPLYYREILNLLEGSRKIYRF
jgi:hypothetical protein